MSDDTFFHLIVTLPVIGSVLFAFWIDRKYPGKPMSEKDSRQLERLMRSQPRPPDIMRSLEESNREHREFVNYQNLSEIAKNSKK